MKLIQQSPSSPTESELAHAHTVETDLGLHAHQSFIVPKSIAVRRRIQFKCLVIVTVFLVFVRRRVIENEQDS